MKRFIALLGLALALLGVSGGAQPGALQFKELSEDTKLTTASGATFTVNKGWHVARADDMIVI